MPLDENLMHFDDKTPALGGEPYALRWQNAARGCQIQFTNNVTLGFCLVSEVFILGPCCFLFNIPHCTSSDFEFPVKRNSCALSCTWSKLVKVSQVTVCTFFFLLFQFLLFLLTLWYEDQGEGRCHYKSSFLFVLLFLRI
jgi:hypothetical protein